MRDEARGAANRAVPRINTLLLKAIPTE